MGGEGRRGGSYLSTSGSFTLSSGESNRAGNSERQLNLGSSQNKVASAKAAAAAATSSKAETATVAAKAEAATLDVELEAYILELINRAKSAEASQTKPTE